MKYFFDTYAIIEFLKGNQKYIKYFKKGGMLTNLNLMELYFQILKNFGKHHADKVYAVFVAYVVEYDKKLMKEAMKFRLQLQKRKRDISYADAIGYLVAKKKKVRF